MKSFRQEPAAPTPLSIKLKLSTLNRLNLKCAELGITKVEFIRQCIRFGLDSNPCIVSSTPQPSMEIVTEIPEELPVDLPNIPRAKSLPLLSTTGMYPPDVAKFGLVALHKLHIELDPHLNREKELAEYIRNTRADYKLLLEYEKHPEEAVAHLDRTLYTEHPRAIGDLVHTHNTCIRPLVYMMSQLVKELRGMQGFTEEMLMKKDKYHDKFAFDFERTDNPVTKFYKVRLDVTLPGLDTEDMLVMVLEQPKLDEYYRKISGGNF